MMRIFGANHCSFVLTHAAGCFVSTEDGHHEWRSLRLDQNKE